MLKNINNYTLKTIEILMEEDNHGNIGLTKEALKESKIINNLHIGRDSVEAMEFLYKGIFCF